MGESIASEGKGDYMYVEGRVLSTDGKPIANATIETWETDGTGQSIDKYHLDRHHTRGDLTLRHQDHMTRSTVTARSQTAEAVCAQARTAAMATELLCQCPIQFQET